MIAAGYSIYAAAKILGVSPRAVRKWMAGEERAAKGKTAEASRLAAENKRLEPRSRAEAPEWLRHNLWVQRLRGQT
ncbi:MAG: helix-turn-helix domain-containing protein [Thermofilum sp.]